MLAVATNCDSVHLTDILLVRMTSDFVRPPEKRYNYSNALGGLVTLVKEEGVHGLFRGLGTNVVSLVAFITRFPGI